MKDQPLIHWDIPGMKWGVRRKLRTNTDRSVKQKSGQEALDNRRAASAHKANVKVLKKQIPKADIDNFNRASKIISEKEKKMNAELDAKKLGGLADLKEFLKIDKEFLRQMTEDIPRADLEIEQTNYDN